MYIYTYVFIIPIILLKKIYNKDCCLCH